MKSRCKAVAGILFLALCNLMFFSTSRVKNENFLTEKQAREEAEIVINTIKKMHPNPHWFKDETLWDDYVEKLLSRKGDVSIAQHYFDLAYLFSLVTDTHTQIYPDLQTRSFLSVYPIRFRSFSDGLYIISSNEDYKQFVGKRVISFGDMKADSIMNILADYVSADHPIRKKTLAEFLLVMPEMYEVFGLSSRDKKVKMVVEDLHGKRETTYLDKLEDKSFAKVFYEDPISFGIYIPDGWTSVFDVFGIEIPDSRADLRNNYWKKELQLPEGGTALLIQINSNSDNENGESQYDFILRTFQEIRASEYPIDRVIVDLRYDLGGWIRNTAALSGLLYGAGYNKLGKTVVLIGRECVSAGTILAADIEMSNNAYFIGEPSGSRPNMFLDHVQIDLPYSNFFAECATEKYISTTMDDSRRYLVPDLKIYESFEEFISGKDIALEKALSITTKEMEDYNDGYYSGELWKRSSQFESVE